MNSLNIIGRLTQEPEQKFIKSDFEISEFNIAQNAFIGGKEHTNYFKCKAFGKTAELINKYCAKGMRVGISGEIQQERWEKDGKKQSKIIIIAQKIDFLSKKNESEHVRSSANSIADQFNGTITAQDSADDLPF